MSFKIQKRALSCAIVASLFAPTVFASGAPTDLDRVQVTSFKIPVAIERTTNSVTVVDAAELRGRGATDLRTALALVSGVDIAPGGDGGPASSVPAMQGLREFDAFLLLVDGVPAGGAFTPALATLSLANVERIEVLKGAAPVSYGATSFVGVIHVIHYAAGATPTQVEVGVGSRGGARYSGSLPLKTTSQGWNSALLVDGERQELAADRAGWTRNHAMYRGSGALAGGTLTLDAEVSRLDQEPASPHPREGTKLSTRVPLDANHNPGGARHDETRSQLSAGYTLPTSLGAWESRLAYTRSAGKVVRGFLREDFATDGVTVNADGYQQHREISDLYLDSHFTTALSDQATLVWGVDHLQGKGEQRSDNFEYAVRGDGRNPPDFRTLGIDERTELEDERGFTGVYADLGWAVTDAWRVELGARFNLTRETREGEEIPEPVPAADDSQHRNENRWSGAVATSYRFWGEGSEYLTAFASYRDMFKPAVIDFGPEAEADILQPESAHSSEIGVRGSHLAGRLQWEASAFQTDFRNLVVSQAVNGRPALTNAGSERFKGAEAEVRMSLADALHATATWAYHDARFQDYSQLFGSTMTQLRGKRLELSPQHLASLGLEYRPEDGLHGYVTASHVGERYLNKRNTSLASSYTTVDAGFGYRYGAWDFRIDGTNLGDRRDAVAESELGDAQYYLMPARTTWFSVRYDFGSNR